MIELIICDYDGVLYLGTDFCLQRIINNANVAGVKPPTKKFLKANWGPSILELTNRISQKYHWDKLGTNLFKYYEKTDKTCAPAIPGLNEMLKKLKENKIKLAIISNRRRHTLEETSKKITLNLKLFDGIYALMPNGTGGQKPNPEVFDTLINQIWPPINVNKKQIVFIGDTLEHDLAFARAVGINFIAITSKINPRKNWLSAGVPRELIINSILKLPQALKHLNGYQKTAII